MVSHTRQVRRDRQAKHIASPKAWDRNSNKWIKNPELVKEVQDAIPKDS